MHAQILTDDLARTLSQERVARSLEAFRARQRAPRGCPLVRLISWIRARRRPVLDRSLLAR